MVSYTHYSFQLFHSMVRGREGDADDTSSQSSNPSFLDNSPTRSLDEVATPSTSSGVPTQGAAEEELPARQRPASTRRRRLQKDTFFIQLLEEQRKLRVAFEKSKEKELLLREREIRLQEAAAERDNRATEREERLISVLAELCKK